MKNNQETFRIFSIFLVFVFVAIGFSLEESYGAGFVKFEGIDGESKDKNHEDWILLESVKIPSQPDDATKIIHFTKTIDLSSAIISQSTISGQVHERAVLDLCSDRDPEDCQRYDFVNVYFTKYFISASDDELPIEEISFAFEKIIQEKIPPTQLEEENESSETPPPQTPSKKEIPTPAIVQERVPSWVQTTANFWVNGDVSDREFTDGIGFLVREKIIELDEQVAPVDSEEDLDPIVPSWIKESTKWWVDDQVPEDQFLESIKWLIKNNIIKGLPN